MDKRRCIITSKRLLLSVNKQWSGCCLNCSQPFLVPVHGTNYRRTFKLGHFGNSLLLSASLRARNAHAHTHGTNSHTHVRSSYVPFRASSTSSSPLFGILVTNSSTRSYATFITSSNHFLCHKTRFYSYSKYYFLKVVQ